VGANSREEAAFTANPKQVKKTTGQWLSVGWEIEAERPHSNNYSQTSCVVHSQTEPSSGSPTMRICAFVFSDFKFRRPTDGVANRRSQILALITSQPLKAYIFKVGGTLGNEDVLLRRKDSRFIKI
jgi:hypothetical protein